MRRDKIPGIALSILLVVAVVFSWMRPLDATAITRVDEGFQRALASYAIARTLNAVISVAQGTEVSVQVGVGATFAPGQVLDPLNDLVEQFGDWMLAASVAFGIMHVLLEISSFWIFSALLSLSATVWLWLHWRQGAVPALLKKTVIVLLLVRFAVPVAMIGSDWTFKQFMQTDYKQHLSGIDANAKVLEGEARLVEAQQDTTPAPVANEHSANSLPPQPNPTPSGIPAPPGSALSAPDEKKSTMQKFKEKLASLSHQLAGLPQTISNAPAYFENKMEKMKELAEQSITHMLKLIVIFLLQTLIIPIVLLWILYRMGGVMYRSAGAK